MPTDCGGLDCRSTIYRVDKWRRDELTWAVGLGYFNTKQQAVDYLIQAAMTVPCRIVEVVSTVVAVRPGDA